MLEEKKAKLDRAEQQYKRESRCGEPESELGQTSERGFCRLTSVARVKRELLVLSALSYIFHPICFKSCHRFCRRFCASWAIPGKKRLRLSNRKILFSKLFLTETNNEIQTRKRTVSEFFLNLYYVKLLLTIVNPPNIHLFRDTYITSIFPISCEIRCSLQKPCANSKDILFCDCQYEVFVLFLAIFIVPWENHPLNANVFYTMYAN